MASITSGNVPRAGRISSATCGAPTIAANAMYARAAPPDDVVEIGTLLLTAIDATTWRLRGLAGVEPGAQAAGGEPG